MSDETPAVVKTPASGLVPTLKEALRTAESELASFLLREASSLASERMVDPDESFVNYLPLQMGLQKNFYFNSQQQQQIRNTCRAMYASDEVAQNCVIHHQAHTVGDGLTLKIIPKDLGKDPKKLADSLQDETIKTMTENWEIFCYANNFTDRLLNWVERVHRDGEVFLRFFEAGLKYAGKTVPSIRFIDPGYITPFPDGTYRDDSGIKFGTDFESPKSYHYQPSEDDSTTAKTISADEILHDKRNVDLETPRGLPTFYSILTNLRRVSKNLTNVSVLTSILSSIALIRKHETATGAKIDNFLNRQSDGRNRTNPVSGRQQMARYMDPGTVLDAPNGVTYDFPAHAIQSENYIKVIDKELAHIASRFVLPVEWLLGKETQNPLGEGSPVIKNFRKEQAKLYKHVTEIFWKVQSMMGVAPELRLKYCAEFFGPELGVGSTLDQARANEIKLRNGAMSPQTWASEDGRNWAVERAGMIQHRETAQPNEVMPGDSGNTNIDANQKSTGQGGDGETKKNAGTSRGGAQ